jgi:hypothetical protein
MKGILKKIFDIFGAFMAVWLMVWFVKFLFTSKHAWIGWLAIILCIYNTMFCADSWLGLQPLTYDNMRNASGFEKLIGFKF